MSKQTIETLKRYFKRGAFPTEGQFGDLIDSFIHKDGEITINDVKGLVNQLASLCPKDRVEDAEAKLQELIEELEARNSLLERGIELNENEIDAITDSKGQAEGLCPLDGSGKVPSVHLPSYVDDVVEFEGMQNHSIGVDYGAEIVSELPAEYADLPTETQPAGQLYLQQRTYIHQAATFDTGLNAFFYVDSVFAVYNGHTQLKEFYISPDPAKLEAFGEVTQQRTAVPVKGKIYVDVLTAKQYRWSGTTLSELSKPIELGTSAGQAYPGDAGRDLSNKISQLGTRVDGLGAYVDVIGGIDVVNISSLAALFAETMPDSYTDIFENLTSAVNFLVDVYEYSFDIWLTNKYQCVTYLEGTTRETAEWVRYRLKVNPLDSDPLDIANWEKVEEPVASGGGATCDCSENCKANSAAIVKLQSDMTEAKAAADNANATATGLSGLVATLQEQVTTAKNNATSAKSQATQAKNAAKTAQDDVDALKTTVETLQTQVNGMGADKIEFVTYSDELEGYNRGAHPSGGTYFMPANDTEVKNLMVVPQKTGGGLVFLLPTLDSYEGKTIRVLDPRTGCTATAPTLGICPADSSHKILGCEKASDNLWIALRGGYVELVGVKTYLANGDPENLLNWVVTKKVDF